MLTHFVRNELALTNNLPLLVDARTTLRERFNRSNCGQQPHPQLVADALAATLHTMWRRWGAMKSPCRL